ncbi:hypothetical protein ACFOOM_06765 [Streptomyces echinoruber]|uniref:Uncharacterized protein n=1 Tax=Streptomyces echinoruber TaxID=68898 RepID=A0A918QZV9_9ACTN|nr:hypothetical protein [Streptomyces echinoruber]GGZ79143.1 hypothetical protein GCM10010389_15940 [Streptomyces echinoruber]
MPAPRTTEPSHEPSHESAHESAAVPAADPATVTDLTADLTRWAIFSCVLVPVVLLWCGTSLAGAAGTALGLAAVTVACRLLLRRSERGAARTAAARHAPAHGRRHRPGAGARRGGRHAGGGTPVG